MGPPQETSFFCLFLFFYALILFPFVRDPQECKAYVAIPPIFGPPRRHHGGRSWLGPDPKGGGGDPFSTNPKIVARNNVLRRRRFGFRHTAGGIFSSTLCVCTQSTQNFVDNSKRLKSTKKVM